MPDPAPDKLHGTSDRAGGEPALEITPEALGALLRAADAVQLIDVRDPWEAEIAALPAAVAIPMSVLAERLAELDPTGRTILICHHGVRSAHAAVWLRQQGFTGAVSVRGGIDAYAREVDTSLATY